MLKCKEDINELKREHIGGHINRLSKDIRYSINSFLTGRGFDLTGEQSRIIGYISFRNSRGECVHQKDIENAFGIKRSSVASILANMEKGGYIIREAEESDGRLKKVLLTDKSRELNAKMGKTIEGIEEVITRGMSETEKAELLRLIKLAINNIETSDIIGSGNDREICIKEKLD